MHDSGSPEDASSETDATAAPDPAAGTAPEGSSLPDDRAAPHTNAVGASPPAAEARVGTPATDLFSAPPALPMAHTTAWLILFGMLFGRALAPALPGARAGFERWITWGDQLGSVLTQAALLVGTLTTVVLLLTTLRQSTLGIVYRLLTAVLGAGVLTVVMTAHRGRIRADSILVVALVTSLVALWGSFLATRSARTRGAGLVLLAAGVSSLSHMVARTLALYASENALVSLFDVARSIATLGMLCDVLALALAALWIIARNRARGLSIVVAGVLAAVTLVWAGAAGALPDANLFQILAGRSLNALTQHPAPWVPSVVRVAIEVFSLSLVAGVLLEPAQRRLSVCVIALALLARGSTDIPLCAMSLLLATLLAPIRLGVSEDRPDPEVTGEDQAPSRPAAV